MKDRKVSHKGVVRSITEKTINVEILSKSACSECHAKMMCSASDMKVKNIEVKRRFYDQYEVGEEVYVSLTKTMGYKAVAVTDHLSEGSFRKIYRFLKRGYFKIGQINELRIFDSIFINLCLFIYSKIYQLAFFTPGIKPLSAISLKLILEIPNFLT